MKIATSLTRTTSPNRLAKLLSAACAVRLLPLLLLLTRPALGCKPNSPSRPTTAQSPSPDTPEPALQVTIPSAINGLPVNSIGRWAFDFCTSLTSVTIGNSVTQHRGRGVSRCTGLTNVTLGTKVISIGTNAFWGCASLTAITVDALNPFYSGLNGVLFSKSQAMLIQYPGGRGGGYTIPASVTNIGDYAFR